MKKQQIELNEITIKEIKHKVEVAFNRFQHKGEVRITFECNALFINYYKDKDMCGGSICLISDNYVNKKGTLLI